MACVLGTGLDDLEVDVGHEGAEGCQVDGVDVVDGHDGVRVAEAEVGDRAHRVDARRRPARRRVDGGDLAHRHAGQDREAVRARRRTLTVRTPASVAMRTSPSTRRRRASTRPGPGSGCRCRSSRPGCRRRCRAPCRASASSAGPREADDQAVGADRRADGRTSAGPAPPTGAGRAAGRRRRTRKSLPRPWCFVSFTRKGELLVEDGERGERDRVAVDVAPSGCGDHAGTTAPGARRSAGCGRWPWRPPRRASTGPSRWSSSSL